MKKIGIIKDTVNTMKKNWKKIGLIIVFDILFVLLLINLRFVVVNINGWFFGLFYNLESITGIAAISSLVITEFLFLVAVYSFFKYLVLGNIQEMFRKTGLKFNRFFSFIKLNWIIVGPIIVIYAVFFILATSYLSKKISGGISSPSSLLFNFLIIVLLLLISLIYLYTFINLSHSIFLKEKRLKKVLKLAFINSFKFNSYKIYWSNLKVIFICSIILLVFYAFMKLFVLTSTSAYLRYGGIYRTGLIAIIIVTGYFLLLFNRINFYRITIKGIE